MTRWHLRRRDDGVAGIQIDASNLRRNAFSRKAVDEIASTTLAADGARLRLDELFELTAESSDHDELIVEGDLANVHGLASGHDSGIFRIRGDVGDYVGCGMTGGEVTVEGNCGDFAGAPEGARKAGMSGGQLHIRGNTGNYAGHRMRRGTLTVGGSAGSYAAASMIAGTIVIAGPVGNDLAVGMRRGTIVLASEGCDSDRVVQAGSESGRFSEPIPFTPRFLVLYRGATIRRLLDSVHPETFLRSRGDRTVDGVGELIYRQS